MAQSSTDYRDCVQLANQSNVGLGVVGGGSAKAEQDNALRRCLVGRGYRVLR